MKILFFLIAAALPVSAAKVDYVVGKASAPAHAELQRGEHFGTGAKSTSQVSLDKGFFRVGSKAQVQVVTGNGVSLEQGVMLLGSDAGKRRASMIATTPGYKLEVKGSVLVAYYPGQYIKITVLEGKIKVALQSLTGEFETLKSGQMLIINPADKRLPEPVEVDLNRLVSTCQLLGGPLGAPSTNGLIMTAAAQQSQGFLTGDLARTPFEMRGASPEVSLALPNRTPQEATSLRPDEQSVFRSVNDIEDPNATVKEANYIASDGSVSQSSIGDITINRRAAKAQKLIVKMSSATVYDNMTGNDVFVSAPEIKGTIRVNPDVFGGTNRELDFIVTGETADTNDRTLMVRSGTDIQTPSHVGLRIQAALGVNITGALLKAGNANATDEPMIIGSQTGNVTLQSSTVSGGNLEVRGSTTDNVPQKLTVDHSTLTSRHDAVIGTPTKQTIIELRNSTQLSSLVGSITVQSKGGPVMVDTSALTASKGTITLDSYDSQDPNANALVTLHNANLAADVIRVRGSSASGDALIIDGGTFNASSLIKFYGGSASTLHFINNTTLTAPTSVLAAGTVQVDGGSTVTINGSGQVFTDHANFNDGTHGTINASKGLNTQSYSGRPKF